MTVNDEATSRAWVSVDMETGALCVAGELDLCSAPVVQAELTLLLQAGVGRQVVDLSSLSVLAAAGVRALCNVSAMAKRTAVDVVFVVSRRSPISSVVRAVARVSAIPRPRLLSQGDGIREVRPELLVVEFATEDDEDAPTAE